MGNKRLSGRKRYIFLFILGMVVFLYPSFSNLYYSYLTMGPQVHTPSSGFVKEPAEQVKDITVSDGELEQIKSDPEMKPLLSKELDYIRAYNKKLGSSNGETPDPFGDGSTPKLEPGHDGDRGAVFAYIKIPRINQTLPVYLGATEEHLKKGAAVIKGTSIPVGGENTNSVIAGHTGMVKKLFSDLPELGPGDEITITNPWETLYYKVTGNKLIWPDQEEYLSVVPGKDMITLLTCYHGTQGNDRLLVFAERYYPVGKAEVNKQEKRDERLPQYISEVELEVKPWYKKSKTLLGAAAVILFFLFLYTFFSKKKDINKE